VRFDWLKFCTQHHIPFVTSGPNTARGGISIQCPWCGQSDPSQHMGLSQDTKNPVWGCLRNPQHRGRDPRRLVQILLRCSYQQALSIVKEHNVTVPDEFDTLTSTAQTSTQPKPITELSFPKEFRRFNVPENSRYAGRFLDYIAQRGFGDNAREVCEKYGLRYALTGDQAWRIIIPIYDADGRLKNWTGRAIGANVTLRYKNAVDSGKGLLFNEAHVRSLPFRPRSLFVVEGPWDCMKVDFYGHQFYCAAVAILGTSITEEQLARIALLGSVVDQLIILMDPEAFNINALIESSLSGVSSAPVVLGQVPSGVEDPGALTPKQVGALCNKYRTQDMKTLL
jgi:hypothetical protein